MTHRHILASIERLAAQTARRTARLAAQSQFTAEEILSDVAIEARSLLMRRKWAKTQERAPDPENMGPPGKDAETPTTPPHQPKIPRKGDTR